MGIAPGMLTPPGMANGASGGGQGPLWDVNTIPALTQMRNGVLPAFGGGAPAMLSDATLGIYDVPAPWRSAGNFYGLPPNEQQDVYDLWSILGYNPTFAQWQLQQASPGYRSAAQKAFTY